MRFNSFRLAAMSFFITLSVSAAEFHFKLVPPESDQSPVHWLESGETRFPVIKSRTIEGQPLSYYVTLVGSFSMKDSNLLYQNQKVALGDKDEFKIEVNVTSSEETIDLVIIDTAGNVQVEKSRLLFPEWEAFLKEQREVISKKFSISPGLGFSLITYQQTSNPFFTELALNLKVSAEYWLKGPWSLAGNAFLTMLPVFSSSSGNTIQFVGMNFKVGYQIPELLPASWNLKLMLGGYYNTSFGSLPSLGYTNLFGPELYPVLSRRFSDERSAWLYLKYSPIINGFQFVSFSSAEFAVGCGYSLPPLENEQVISITLDIALLSLQYASGSAHVNSYTLGGSYRF